jgi:hypothetical protein
MHFCCSSAFSLLSYTPKVVRNCPCFHFSKGIPIISLLNGSHIRTSQIVAALLLVTKTYSLPECFRSWSPEPAFKLYKKMLSLSPWIFRFTSDTTCPRTNLVISFHVNASHVIAVCQNLLPGLQKLLRFVEMYLKHATERPWVGIPPGSTGGRFVRPKRFSTA